MLRQSAFLLLAVLGLALQTCHAFVLLPGRHRTAEAFGALSAKGFGQEKPKREKSEGQKVREDASENYDELKASGVPEYNIFIREAGMGDTAWIPAGVMAVPRTEKVDSAIYANEEQLVSSVLRTFPGLKTAEAYEYGYNRQVFPDDPIRVARPPSNDFVGNLLNQVLSPLNTKNVKKDQ